MEQFCYQNSCCHVSKTNFLPYIWYIQVCTRVSKIPHPPILFYVISWQWGVRVSRILRVLISPYFRSIFFAISRGVLRAQHSLPLPEAALCRLLPQDYTFFRFFWDRTSLFFFGLLFEIGLCFPLLWSVGNLYFQGFKSVSPPHLRSDFWLSDLRSRRCPISKTTKKKEKKKQPQIKEDGKGHNSRNSGPTPVARGGSGAKAHPLAARPMSCPER